MCLRKCVCVCSLRVFCAKYHKNSPQPFFMTSKTTPLKKKKIISSSKSFHFSSFYGVVYVGFRICVEIKSKNIPSKKLLFIIHQCFRELFQEVLTENLVFQLANFYALILSDITKFLTIAAAVLRPP